MRHASARGGGKKRRYARRSSAQHYTRRHHAGICSAAVVADGDVVAFRFSWGAGRCGGGGSGGGGRRDVSPPAAAGGGAIANDETGRRRGSTAGSSRRWRRASDRRRQLAAGGGERAVPSQRTGAQLVHAARVRVSSFAGPRLVGKGGTPRLTFTLHYITLLYIALFLREDTSRPRAPSPARNGDPRPPPPAGRRPPPAPPASRDRGRPMRCVRYLASSSHKPHLVSSPRFTTSRVRDTVHN